jgi:hypothetical protein
MQRKGHREITIIDASQLTFHKFGTGLTLYSSHNHSISIPSFIYPLKSMEYDGSITNKSIAI